MCKPIDWILRLVNTLKVVVDSHNGLLAILICVLCSGFIGVCVIYSDFKEFLTEQTRNQAIQTEVLRTIDQRLTNLERKQ